MKPLKKICLSESMIELSDSEMKMTVGGSGSGGNTGSGSGGDGVCWWECVCDTPNKDGTILSIIHAGSCSGGGPWDREPACPNGYQNCEPF